MDQTDARKLLPTAGPHLDKDQVRMRGRKVMDALAHVR
jgi:hypothetical protein